MNQPKLLVIGGLPKKDRPESIGGATILIQNLITYLEAKSIKYTFIDTIKFCNSKFKRFNTLFNLIYLSIVYIPKLLSCDIVMFNFSNRGFIKVMPLLTKIANFVRKKIVIRKFAGSMEVFWDDISERNQRKVLETCKKADLILLETQEAIKFLDQQTNNTLNISWFPNIREPQPNISARKAKIPRKFVFISLVTKTKGVDEILEAAKHLPKDFTIDIYGKIENHEYSAEFLNASPNISYHHILSPKDVIPKLKEFDMLLLPSYNEGYPGILLEAFSVGMPAITTNCGGIPEIVTNKFNSILINPRSSSELLEAMTNIDDTLYAQMSENALNTFNLSFNSENVNKKIVSQIVKISQN